MRPHPPNPNPKSAELSGCPNPRGVLTPFMPESLNLLAENDLQLGNILI
jgi:hypothetical protein